MEKVKELPAEIDVDDMIYHLYLRQKLETAEKDIKEGRVISHEDVKREASKWFGK